MKWVWSKIQPSGKFSLSLMCGTPVKDDTLLLFGVRPTSSCRNDAEDGW